MRVGNNIFAKLSPAEWHHFQMLNVDRKEYEHLGRELPNKPSFKSSFKAEDDVSVSVVEQSMEQSIQDMLMQNKADIEDADAKLRVQYPKMFND